MVNHRGKRTKPNARARTVSALAVMLLALAGTTLSACADRPGARPPAAGRPVAVEPALLSASALGADWAAGTTSVDGVRWPWAQEDCPGYRDGDFPAQRHRQAAAARQYLRTTPRAAALQVVEAYEPEWAGRALDDVRRVLLTCGSYPAYGGQVSFSLLDSDFAGDGALLVRGRIVTAEAPAAVSYFVVVRRGLVVSTLNLPDPGDESGARAVAARLVEQLDRV
ncbi:hypothetical protein OG792_33695 [Micromonospora sp. NBC_01699]|uniref:hypothetical protein n=1 Tax=Micromonospora sp. NBC_01699 TaxID=2975984 RepID=UPI002E2B8113|nr:hypothetical protein [Micromonospora sp. NBC_01699]